MKSKILNSILVSSLICGQIPAVTMDDPGIKLGIEIVPISLDDPHIKQGIEVVPISLDDPDIKRGIELMPISLNDPNINLGIAIVPISLNDPNTKRGIEIISMSHIPKEFRGMQIYYADDDEAAEDQELDIFNKLKIVDMRQKQARGKTLATAIDLTNFDEDNAKAELEGLPLSSTQLSRTWDDLNDALDEKKEALIVLATQLTNGQVTTSKVIHISPELKSKVMEFAETEDLQIKISEANWEYAKASRASTQVSYVEEQMSAKERSFPTWLARFLGGSKSKIDQYKEAKNNRDHLSALATDKIKTKDEALEAVRENIKQWLYLHDRRFAKMMDIAKEFEIFAEQGAEALVLASTNGGDAIYIANNYSASIKKFRKGLQHFQKDMEPSGNELLDFRFNNMLFQKLEGFNYSDWNKVEPNYSYSKEPMLKEIRLIKEALLTISSEVKQELDQIADEVIRMAMPSLNLEVEKSI